MDLSSAVIFVAGHGPLDCACNTLLISLIARWNLQQESVGKIRSIGTLLNNLWCLSKSKPRALKSLTNFLKVHMGQGIQEWTE